LVGTGTQAKETYKRDPTHRQWAAARARGRERQHLALFVASSLVTLKRTHY
jgi:hypothetical protein